MDILGVEELETVKVRLEPLNDMFLPESSIFQDTGISMRFLFCFTPVFGVSFNWKTKARFTLSGGETDKYSVNYILVQICLADVNRISFPYLSA